MRPLRRQRIPNHRNPNSPNPNHRIHPEHPCHRPPEPDPFDAVPDGGVPPPDPAPVPVPEEGGAEVVGEPEPPVAVPESLALVSAVTALFRADSRPSWSF